MSNKKDGKGIIHNWLRDGYCLTDNLLPSLCARMLVEVLPKAPSGVYRRERLRLSQVMIKAPHLVCQTIPSRRQSASSTLVCMMPSRIRLGKVCIIAVVVVAMRS